MTKTTRGFFGTLNYKAPLDNSFELSFQAGRKQGGEYRNIPIQVFPKPFCDFINEDKFFIPELNKTSNFAVPIPCPFPPVS